MSMASFIPDPECELERSELLIGINARSPKSETTGMGRETFVPPTCALEPNLGYIYIYSKRY